MRIPPGRAWSATSSESCVLCGQPSGRSVDSECSSRAIQPRNYRIARSLCCAAYRGHGGAAYRPAAAAPAGVREHGIDTEGSPGTWETLVVSRRFLIRYGDRTTNPWPAVVRLGPLGAKRQTRRLVLPNEGNEVRREGRRESEHLIVPLASGNLNRRDPIQGRGCRVTGPLAGKRARALYLGSRST